MFNQGQGEQVDCVCGSFSLPNFTRPVVWDESSHEGCHLSPCLGCEIPKQADLAVLQVLGSPFCSCCLLCLSAFPDIHALPSPFVTALKSLSGPSQGHAALVSLPPPPSSPDTSLYTHCPHSVVCLPCTIFGRQGTCLCVLLDTIVGLPSVIAWPLTHVACILSMPVYWEVEWRNKMNRTWCLPVRNCD